MMKTITFKTYGDYLKYETLDDKMSARMLHLPQKRTSYKCSVSQRTYGRNDGHRSAKTVDATEGYQDPQSGQKYIIMIN